MKKWLLTTWLFVEFLLPAGGQGPVFKNYTTSDGLPSSEIYTTIQDDRGYIWIGTDRGIVRYDGYGFKVYTTAEGLPDNTVFEFFKADGKIWFKTFSSAIGYIQNDSIYNYKYNNVLSAILPNQVLSAMLIRDEEIVFVRSPLNEESKIFKIDKNGRLDSVRGKKNGVKNIYVNNKGLRVNEGFFLPGLAEVFSYETGEKIGSFMTKRPVPNNYVSLLKTAEGFYLYADLQVFLYKEGQFRKILDCPEDVISLYADTDDNLWMGYLHGGMECYYISKDYKEKISLLGKYSVSSINQDSEKGFWITTLEKAIFYLTPSSPVSFTEEDGLRNSSVKRLEKIGDKVIIILSDNSVVIKDIKSPGFIPVLGANTKYTDITGSPWGTVYRTNYQEFNIPVKNKVVEAGYAKRLITGNKYVYSINPSTIEIMDREGRVLKTLQLSTTPRIITVCEQDSGDVLIGTLRGTFLYKGDTAIPLRNVHPLYTSRISEIKKFNKEYTIFTTIGNGLFVIRNGDYSRPLHYTTLHGLPGMMCNDVVMVNDSITWVATNRGLCYIKNILNPEKAAFFTLDINNGIVSNEINSICKVDSFIWVGTTNGITILPAYRLPGEIPAVPLHIERILVNGNLISRKEEIKLSHLENNINIFFTGINFQYGGELLYKYRLKGDKNWNYTTSRSVVYSALPPGDYTFELGLVKPTGGENPLLAHYSFTILPPVWKTWWFITLLAFTAALGIYLFITYRVQFVRNREQLKNELDRFRDKALRDQMNPHFIYNSLNSIQNFILKNDSLESAAFLSKFSRLMRLIFNHTSQEKVTVEKDLEALVLYSELENLRFPNKFTLHVEHNLGADVSRVVIPPLIFQPFVENAILHGLLTKNSPGNIRLSIVKHADILEVAIADDGVGRPAAAEVSKRKAKFFPPKEFFSGKTRTSGITATMERIEQAWKKKAGKSNFKIIDLRDENNSPCGTAIQFCLPVNYD